MSRSATGAGRRSRETTKPLLIFFSAASSGPARRMESLLAHFARKERERLDISRVDIEQDPDTARKYGVSRAPALVLVKARRAVARFEGRAKAAEIEALVQPHLD